MVTGGIGNADSNSPDRCRSAPAAGYAGCPSTLMTRGWTLPACAIARRRKPFASAASRYRERRKSMVLPAESTALFRYVHCPATRI